jgi:hypothetical protein
VSAARPPTRLSYGAVAAGIGGLLLILSLFLDWYYGANAFQIFSIVDLFLLLVGFAALAFAAIEAMGANVNLPVNRVRALTVLGIIATSIVWAFLIEAPDIQFGFILAALAAAAILAGGILAERSPNLGVANPAASAGGPGGGIGAGGGFGGGGQPQAPPAAAPASAPAPAAAAAPAPAAAAPAPPASGGQPADWYPDPRGEKRLRYWDGGQWTDHTAD